MVEFMALASHRKAIGPAVGEAGDRIRQAQLAAITATGKHYQVPPSALAFLPTAIPRMIDFEEAFGTSAGHAEPIARTARFPD
jgi:hypothetical protein